MKNIIFTLILAFSLVSFANPKTILFSDVDDTLKMTNVGGMLSGVPSVLHTSRGFDGMQEIYREMEKNNLFFHFYYVSSAPLLLMQKRHQQFLNKADFPLGQLILRMNGSAQYFKAKTISDIIIREKPTQVILIGDNAEEDPQIYHTVQSQFPQIQFSTFIHFVKSPQRNNVKPNQIGYAYAAELAYHLMQAKYLPTAQTDKLMALINDRIPFEENSKDKSFPDWLDCRGHQFNFSGTAQLDLTNQNVLKYCH